MKGNRLDLNCSQIAPWIPAVAVGWVAYWSISHAAVRNMRCCAVAGQGAGVAAAVSVKTGVALDRLDVGAVQAELRRQGARID